jgi:hypothetical protein
MPRSRIALSIAAEAPLKDPPGGRLKEIVAATRPLWWLTWVAVWLLRYEARAGSGTMVSAAVLSALPVEVPPRLFEMLLVTELACALALSELVLDEVVCAAETAENVVRPLTVPPCAWVCCVPVTFPAAALRCMRSSICGCCQYVGATSITTKY